MSIEGRLSMIQLQLGEIIKGFQWNASSQVRKTSVLGVTWRMNLAPFFVVEQNSEISRKIM